MLQAIVDFFGFIVSKPWGLIVALLNWLENFVTITIPNVIWSMMPVGLADFLDGIDLVQFLSIVEPVTWFFPIWGIMAVYITAYGFAALIRVVRFSIGFIPTVDG